MDIKEKGRSGEDIAEEYLRQNGYRICERNFRAGQKAEIDIIATDGDVLAFVEVKLRTSVLEGYGREAVTKAKQKNIRFAAQWYLQKTKQWDRFCRFDVVEITALGGETEIELIKNAF